MWNMEIPARTWFWQHSDIRNDITISLNSIHIDGHARSFARLFAHSFTHTRTRMRHTNFELSASELLDILNHIIVRVYVCSMRALLQSLMSKCDYKYTFLWLFAIVYIMWAFLLRQTENQNSKNNGINYLENVGFSLTKIDLFLLFCLCLTHPSADLFHMCVKNVNLFQSPL